MQAKLSSTAWESGNRSGQFAALRHVFRSMQHDDAGCDVHGPAAEVAGGVAEGAGLAHDAGNLLGALSLYSDLLALPGVLHEEYRAYAAELRLLSDRSWAMIHRLVNHAEAKPSASLEPEPIVLPEVVEGCRGLLSKVAGQVVNVSYGAGAFGLVRVPSESVERILINLVKNAAEATPWVGAISVKVEGIDDGVRQRVAMTVRDKGCGMDPATVQGLMQPGGISSAGGRGLGFRVVRELAAMSGGCLNIESQVDVGTSIAVEWYALDDCEGRDAVVPDFEERGAKTAMRADARSMAC